MKILITGGSGNGKSYFAESLAASLPLPRLYVATMRPGGDGYIDKVARHVEMRRGKGFTSIDRYTDVGALDAEPGATVLLECMCNLTANEMFDDMGDIDPSAYERTFDGVLTLGGKCANLIVVTNDVGSEHIGRYDAGTAAYVAMLGQLNAALAAQFDTVYEVVAGIPLTLKGTT